MSDVKTFTIDPTNGEQADAWNGAGGEFWATHAEHFDRALACYRDAFLTAAALAPGDRVLDIGCGTGETTRDAATFAVDGSALGVDLSARMVDLARRLAAAQGTRNVAFEQADAQVYPFEASSFDVAISRTGTMFFGDFAAAFSNIRRTLREGGRLVTLVWQGPGPNEWIRAFNQALAAGRQLPTPPVGERGPFAFAEPERSRSVLADGGFASISVESLAGPMWFGTDTEDAFAFVLGLMGWMLEDLDLGGRRRAHDALRAALAAHESRDGVTFESATWLVQAMCS